MTRLRIVRRWRIKSDGNPVYFLQRKTWFDWAEIPTPRGSGPYCICSTDPHKLITVAEVCYGVMPENAADVIALYAEQDNDVLANIS